MKAARIIFRVMGWICFVIGIMLVVSWALLERWPGMNILIACEMPIEMVFYLGAGIGLVGVIVTLTVEDDSSWRSISGWLMRKKK